MIIKVVDNFFYTKLSHDSAKALIEKLLEEHIRELADFDMEHFIEALEETDKFEAVEENGEADFEVTQDQIDELVNDILEEDYDMEEDEDEEDEEELDMDDEEDEDDDGEGWD